MDKKIKAYIENPNHCPKCGSEEITAGDYDFDGRHARSEVVCDKCGAEWQDIYTLTEVEIISK
jgi:predicted RNA-binding Zn-ribbon protein involved in translation (DUF1610 family)